MATLAGAEALGLDEVVGSLAAGRLAAMVAVSLDPGDSPLEAVTSGPPVARRRVVHTN